MLKYSETFTNSWVILQQNSNIHALHFVIILVSEAPQKSNTKQITCISYVLKNEQEGGSVNQKPRKISRERNNRNGLL